LFVPIYLNKASFFTDLIGVIIDVGPYDFASPTSNKKLQKIQICDLEYASSQRYDFLAT
jgi:hypothetical protein